MRLVAPRSPRRLGALPMTSMIDVVFLLLIFFMVTANFAEDEAELSSALQSEGRGAATQNLRPQVLTVTGRDGRAVFSIGARTISSRPELMTVLRSLPKEQGVIVRVMDDAPIEAAAMALQSAADAGFRKRTYVPASAE